MASKCHGLHYLSTIFSLVALPSHQRTAQSLAQPCGLDDIFSGGAVCFSAPLWGAPHILQGPAIVDPAYVFEILLPIWL
jgi:hypothetical protein